MTDSAPHPDHQKEPEKPVDNGQQTVPQKEPAPSPLGVDPEDEAVSSDLLKTALTEGESLTEPVPEPDSKPTSEPTTEPKSDDVQALKQQLEEMKAKMEQLEEAKALMDYVESDPELYAMIEKKVRADAAGLEGEGQNMSSDKVESLAATVQALQKQVATLLQVQAVERFFASHPEAVPYRAAMAEIAEKHPQLTDLDLIFRLAKSQGEPTGQGGSQAGGQSGSAQSNGQPKPSVSVDQSPRQTSDDALADVKELVEKANTRSTGELAELVAKAVAKRIS